MTHKFCTIGTLRHHKVKEQWIPPRHWSKSEQKKIVVFNEIIRSRDPNELRAAPTAFNWKLFTSPSFCCYTILMFWKCCITLWVCNLLSTPLYTFFSAGVRRSSPAHLCQQDRAGFKSRCRRVSSVAKRARLHTHTHWTDGHSRQRASTGVWERTRARGAAQNGNRSWYHFGSRGEEKERDESARKLLQISERYGAESAGKFSYSLNLIGSLTGFTLLWKYW